MKWLVTLRESFSIPPSLSPFFRPSTFHPLESASPAPPLRSLERRHTPFPGTILFIIRGYPSDRVRGQLSTAARWSGPRWYLVREPRIHRRAFSLPHPLGLPSYSPFRFRFQTRTRDPAFHLWLFHVPYATPFDGPLIAVANERHGHATMNRLLCVFHQDSGWHGWAFFDFRMVVRDRISDVYSGYRHTSNTYVHRIQPSYPNDVVSEREKIEPDFCKGSSFSGRSLEVSESVSRGNMWQWVGLE